MKKRTRWTELLDEYVFRKRSLGEPLRAIAAAIDSTPEAVRTRYVILCEMRGVKRPDWRRKAA